MAQLERTARVSLRVHTSNETDVPGGCRISIEQRRQTLPNLHNLQIHPGKDSRSTLELLYNITDIVLCLCAITFIVSAIAYSTLWILGCALP